jgi:rubrerythrin
LNEAQLTELLYQALETELGGVQIYAAALECARNDDLRKEWTKYHEQTAGHVVIVRDLIEGLGLDPNAMTPGREIVQHIGGALAAAIHRARLGSPPEAAEIVAAECVTLAETKDHANWELIGKVAEEGKGDVAKALREAYGKVEDQEDEHVYHTTGWARELWIDALGMPAVLPPPEEQKDVKTAIGAARAKNARSDLVED